MKQVPTDELDKLLENMKPEQLGEYFKDNSENIVNAEKEFSYYMKDVIAEKNINCPGHKMKLKDIYSTAGFSESMGEKILNMEKHTKNRDNILLLCIAGRFTLEETNRALKLYGMSPLYSKDKRDACLIVAINRRKYDLYDIDNILIENGFDTLSRDIK